MTPEAEGTHARAAGGPAGTKGSGGLAIRRGGWFLLVALTFMTGCPPRDRTPAPASVPQRSASEIREAYNGRTAAIQRMRARAVVEVSWVDEKDKSHWEQGDGPLLVRKPNDLALAIGKLGNVMFWLGRSDQRYWLLELKTPQGQPTTAYVGQIDELDQLHDRQLPLPLRPDQLIDFLGVTPLPDDFEMLMPMASGPGVYQLREKESVEGSRRYWWLDEKLRPTRVGFIDSDGQVIAEASLSQYTSLPIAGAPPGAWPDVASYVEIKLPGPRANVKLNLSDLTTDESKFNDAQFDFDRLVKVYKPQQVRAITP